MKKVSLAMSFLCAFSYVFAQDTTVVKTDTVSIKFDCICNGLYKSKNDLDSCSKKIDKFHKNVLQQYNKSEDEDLNTCKQYHFPYIDFSTQYLIVVTGSFGVCGQPKIERTLYKINSERKYRLVVKIIDQGFCKANIPVLVCLVTPKFEEGYTFEQKVISTREK